MFSSVLQKQTMHLPHITLISNFVSKVLEENQNKVPRDNQILLKGKIQVSGQGNILSTKRGKYWKVEKKGGGEKDHRNKKKKLTFLPKR